MALNGIGSQGGSPLEKFQQARDLARKKLESPASGPADGFAKLAELLARKQAELGVPGKAAPKKGASAAQAFAPASRANEVPVRPGPGGADAKPALNIPATYGRAGAPEKADPKPKLGRYVDFMA